VKRVLIVDKQASSQSHLETRKILEDALVSNDIEFDISSRRDVKKNHARGEFISEDDYKLIISLGGDGTFLHACQLVNNAAIPVFGINSDISLSEGYLLDTDKSNLSLKMGILFSNDVIPVIKYPRLRARVNGSLIPIKAMNEIYVGRVQGYKMAKYELETSNGRKERQKSSGILIVTGIGSTAWFKSAGGEPFSKNAGYSKFLVRECYEGRLTTCNITSGEFSDSIKIKIFATDTIVAMDVNIDYFMEVGDVLEIEFEKNSISIVDFDRKDSTDIIEW